MDENGGGAAVIKASECTANTGCVVDIIRSEN